MNGGTLLNSIIFPASSDWDNLTSTYTLNGQVGGLGNIQGNPLFCGIDYEDYSLYDNSPCLGAGENGANIGALDVGCYANALWVSTNGNDFTGDGSSNNPYRYIQTAINNSSNGEKVIIKPGTYLENINYNKNISLLDRAN